MNNSTIKVNSFFSGIGGFDLGFEKVGFEIQYQCEINKFCTNILKKYWPTLNPEKDITLIEPNSIPKADIWCGGFPCQDVSVARGAMGREGLKGKNSGLFFNFFELIKANMPEVLLIENVTGLLNSHNGDDFRIILQYLTSIGYGVTWRVFNSRYFGVPQSRPRVYICAWKNNLEKAVYTLHEFDVSNKPSDTRTGFLTPLSIPGSDAIVPEVAYCLAATSGRHTGTDWSRTYVSYYNQVRRLTPEESEKLQGFPSGWTVPINFKKNNDIDALRYHAIGNAVSVPVIVWIANRIKSMIDIKTLDKGIKQVTKKFADFSTGASRTQFFSELNSVNLFEKEKVNKIKWQSGGIAYGDEVIDCKIHNCPNDILNSSLIDIVEAEIPNFKYFLSSSAAVGILRRVNSQGRELFPPLMKALQRLAKVPIEEVGVI